MTNENWTEPGKTSLKWINKRDETTCSFIFFSSVFVHIWTGATVRIQQSEKHNGNMHFILCYIYIRTASVAAWVVLYNFHIFVALLVCSAHLLPRSCHICIWTSVRLCCCSTLVDRSSRWSTEDFFFCFVNEKSLLSSFAFLLHTHNLKMYAVIRFAMTCRVECVTRTETNAADTF